MANTSKRGFASMDAAKQREIASKGGRAAHAKGTAHEFTSDEARVAGRKGGEAVSRDRQHMSTIGREGGHSRGGRSRTTSDIARGAGEVPFSDESSSGGTLQGERVSGSYTGTVTSQERPDTTRPSFSADRTITDRGSIDRAFGNRSNS
jgi:uncharacterized protein